MFPEYVCKCVCVSSVCACRVVSVCKSMSVWEWWSYLSQISCENRAWLFSRVINAPVNLSVQPWPCSSCSDSAFHSCAMWPSMMYLYQDKRPSLWTSSVSFSRLAKLSLNPHAFYSLGKEEIDPMSSLLSSIRARRKIWIINRPACPASCLCRAWISLRLATLQWWTLSWFIPRTVVFITYTFSVKQRPRRRNVP